MAKKGKKSKNSKAIEILESEVKPLLELKYGAPLFSMAAHPSKPIIVSGLANGYVFMTEYDPILLSEYAEEQKEKIEEKFKNLKESEQEKKKKAKFWKVEEISKDQELSNVSVKHIWKTKRHKGSVRSICFNADGDEVYTIGSDNVIKKADTQTGKVLKKAEIKDNNSAFTKILKSVTHPILVLGDESGNVRVFDSNTLEQKNFIPGVHEDAINSIIQLTYKSAYQFMSVGSTTLSVWDVRKEKATSTSENQEDEMLSVTFVDPTKGDTVLCGMGEGIATVWKKSKNDWSDQLSRVKIAKDESIDTMISTLNNDDCVWAGASNGTIYKINAKRGQIVETRVHSLADEVSFLDLDSEYRLISAGMDKLKIWNSDRDEDDSEEEGDENLDSSDGSDSEADGDAGSGSEDEFAGFSEDNESSDPEKEEDQWEDEGSANEEEGEETEDPAEQENVEPEEKSGDEEEQEESEPEVQPKKKKQKLSNKQMNNMQKHEHGIRRFDDL
ncbi:hypothetical protein WICPIJ_005013 [Wickerhamomyces pijperi]|uniref:WD repeat-containing protein JIP5 n=1 Tax=Wickerhamomyces pijperi TaxID=599730 RepID=A0A9P8TMC1_WICPI|nr:hypothetical protein WICPIJ_005013 [Wickerhamomyces pijperi]